MFLQLVLFFLLVKSQINDDDTGIAITLNNDNSVSVSYIGIYDEKAISTYIELTNLNKIIKDNIYIKSSYHVSPLSYSFYTILTSKDFNSYSIYNISCGNSIGNDCIYEIIIDDWKYSFSQIHYDLNRDIIFVLSISPETHNYAIYAFHVTSKKYWLVYDIKTKNIIFSSTLMQSKEIMYIDFENNKYTTLIGIDLLKGSLKTFYEPYINDDYYTLSLLNDGNKFIYVLIYNRNIGIIQLISIDTDIEKVENILSYNNYYVHHSSCMVYNNTRIHSFMSNDENIYLVITDLETKTFKIKIYEGNKPLLVAYNNGRFDNV
jgi:hypothetical protein